MALARQSVLLVRHGAVILTATRGDPTNDFLLRHTQHQERALLTTGR